MEINFLQFASNIFTDLGDNQLKYNCKESNGKVCFEGRNEIFNDEFEFTVNKNSVYCKRTIKNVSNETVSLKEISVSYDFLLDENYIDDYYYTTENLRLFHNYTIPVEFDRINC